jgi:AcrR family transcriptional regulator
MAKESRRGNRRSNADAAPPETPARERIIDAMMALLTETPYGRIGLGDIAEAAGVSLATLREAFAGKLGIVAAFMRRIDLAVLAGGAPDMDTGPRDRLFEAEMRRLDALSPYREAVRSLADSARSDPLLRSTGSARREVDAGAAIDHGGVSAAWASRARC